MGVPAPAKHVLDFIAAREAPHGYDTVYANRQDRMPKPVSASTVDELIAGGNWRAEAFGSSACGRYQFMSYTLAALKKTLHLTGGEVMDAALQDRLGYQLLLERGYDRFMAGAIGVVQFGLGIAQEWASFPVLTDCQGQKRRVLRGQSFYAGDGLNKALVSPAAVEAMLGSLRQTTEQAGAQTGSAAALVIEAPVQAAPQAGAFDLPPWLTLARAEIGTKEAPGPANNPVVVRYYTEAGSPGVAKDEVPWCAAFVGAMLHRAGLANSASLMARSYEHWGRALGSPVFGCVGVKTRGTGAQGHVGFVIGASASQVFMLGGNQHDEVCLAAFPRSDFTAFRWPLDFPLMNAQSVLPAALGIAAEALRRATAASAAPQAPVTQAAVPARVETVTGPPIVRTSWFARLFRRKAPAGGVVERPGLSPGGSPDLYDAQKLLKARGYYTKGFADGEDGPLTQEAVAQARKDNGLGDGGVDADLLEQLPSFPQRPVSVKRANLPIREAVKRRPDLFGSIKILGGSGGLLSILGLADSAGLLDTIQSGASKVNDVAGSVQSAFGVVASFVAFLVEHRSLVLIAGGLFLLWKAVNLGLGFVAKIRAAFL